MAAYRWLLQNATSTGGDPSRIAFADESAGGNLAVATAMLARDASLPLPRHIVSVYAIAGSDLNTQSYQDTANGPTLNRALIAWFFRYVPRTPADLMDPRRTWSAPICRDRRRLPSPPRRSIRFARKANSSPSGSSASHPWRTLGGCI